MTSWINEAAAPNQNGNGFPHMADQAAAMPGVTAPGMIDPSFIQGPNAQFGGVAPLQFANPQALSVAGQPNGGMRNASPSFQQGMYQTNPVVPAKRPRPREDSLAGSPRPAPGGLPTSRAETPRQSPFPGYQSVPTSASQQQNPAAQSTPFPHLQPNGSANASPSPIMANQLRPGSVPQRTTASPHPFSPATQQFGTQPSPVQSDHGTPQPGAFSGNPNFPQPQQQGFPQGFAPSPSPAQAAAMSGQMPHAMQAQMLQQQQQAQQHQQQLMMQNAMMQQHQQSQQQQQQQQQPGMGPMGPMMPMGPMGQMGGPMGQMAPQGRNPLEQQKLIFQMQQMKMQQMQQQQQQQGQLANMQQQQQQQQQQMTPQPRGHPGQPMNMMGGKPGMPMANGQMPPGAMGPQSPQRPGIGPTPEGFMRQLGNLLAPKGQILDPRPAVGDEPVNLMVLFQQVQGAHGFQRVTAQNLWPRIAASLGLNLQQDPSIPQQVRQLYERNLIEFEKFYMQGRMQSQMQRQGNPAAGQRPVQPGQQPMMMTPQRGPPGQMPAKQMSPGAQQPAVNGFVHPGPAMGGPHMTPTPHGRAPSRGVEVAQGPEFATPPQPGVRQVSISQPPRGKGMAMQRIPAPFSVSDEPRDYEPCGRQIQEGYWGGVNLASVSELAADLERLKPDVPSLLELGVVDLQALARSLQSGIHGEVRLALDTLATVTAPHQIPQMNVELQFCEELVDALVECAEDQVDLLVEHTIEVSDDIQLSPYEDVVRNCRIERTALKPLQVVGTLEYDLDRAVDRLICITTVLRNLSFGENNLPILADEAVVRFVSSLVRLMGTRLMLLRTNVNTLDLMKDLIIFLSNIAAKVKIPGREQAMCLLLFILSFAPTPGPTLSDGRIFFPAYEPALHPYLPPAVDALAKLLARDEPNRTFYKNIFANDGITAAAMAAEESTPIRRAEGDDDAMATDGDEKTVVTNGIKGGSRLASLALPPDHQTLSSIPYPLLTTTFAMAIATIPDQTRDYTTPAPQHPHHPGAPPPPRPPLLPSVIESRKPTIMQGLLAADILASLAPGLGGAADAAHVPRLWLTSGGGFAQNLFRLVRALCATFDQPAKVGIGVPHGQAHGQGGRGKAGGPQGRGPQGPGMEQQGGRGKDEDLVYLVVLGLGMLRKLSERARGDGRRLWG